jgi:signal transduction histidine kinase
MGDHNGKQRRSKVKRVSAPALGRVSGLPLKKSTAEELAEACVLARTEMARASRVLHDEVGSLLAIAGLRLQLLQMDYPETSERTVELAEALDGAMRHVRALTRKLDPSPVARTGLQNALIDLANRYRDGYGVATEVRYSATAIATPEIAGALYLAAADAVSVAAFTAGVTRVAISATGSRSLIVRVSFDGSSRGVPAKLGAAELLARHSGLRFEVVTGKGTIVAIRYA